MDSFTFGTTPLTLPTSTGLTCGGYTFGGWSVSASGAAVVNPYSPTQTRTLYAVWIGIQYSITYNLNGGTSTVAIPDAFYTTGNTGVTLNNGAITSSISGTYMIFSDMVGNTVSPMVATAITCPFLALISKCRQI